MNSRPDLGKLADVWADLATQPFICSKAAEVTQAVVGGSIFGYWSDDNPSAELGRSEGGHDFVIVDKEWLLDFWAAAYYAARPIYHLQTDAEEVRRLYGERDRWEKVWRKYENTRT